MHPEDPEAGNIEGNRITPEAVDAMAGSLEMIASLHGIQPRRRSWRHGAIAWRCGYLRTLVGRPCDGIGIDRTVRQLRLASIGVLLVGLLVQVGFLA